MTATSRTWLPAGLLIAKPALIFGTAKANRLPRGPLPQLRRLQIQILPERDRGGVATFSLSVPACLKRTEPMQGGNG